jgi:hypothetical protein
MTTLQEQHELAIDQNFVHRVRQAALTIALEVLVEANADYVEYQSRNNLAIRMLNSPIDQSKRLAYALATVAPTADNSAIDDAPLLTFVRNNWTLLSGYNPNAPEAPAV